MKSTTKNDELSMDKIEDYDNHESKEKRSMIIKVIIIGMIIGAIIGILKYSFNEVDDYIGTEQNPGINTTKGY